MSDYKETGEAKDIQPRQDDLDMAKIQASMQGLREQRENELQEDLEEFENRPKPPWVEAKQNEASPVDEGVHWEDRGVVDVPVADLPWPENVHGSQDFNHHITYEDAVSATKRLQEMKPLIEQGYTANDFAQLDQTNGLNYEHGQQRIYELFYGDKAIQAYKDGEQYDVSSGRHRVYVAKELGLDSIPAHLREKVKQVEQ